MSKQQRCRFCSIVPEKPNPKLNSLTQQLLQFNYAEEFYFYFTRTINEIVKGSRSSENIAFEEVLSELSRPKLHARTFKPPLLKQALKAGIHKNQQREQVGEIITVPNLVLHIPYYKSILKGLSKKLAIGEPGLQQHITSNYEETQQVPGPRGVFPMRQESFFRGLLGKPGRNLFVDPGSFETTMHDVYDPQFSSEAEHSVEGVRIAPILHKQDDSEALVRIEEGSSRPSEDKNCRHEVADNMLLKTVHSEDQRVIKESFLLDWTDETKGGRALPERRSSTQLSFEIMKEQSLLQNMTKLPENEKETSSKPKKSKLDLRLDLKQIVNGSSAHQTAQNSAQRAVNYARSLSGRRGTQETKELKTALSGRSRTVSKSKSGVKSQRNGLAHNPLPKPKMEKSKTRGHHEDSSSRDAMKLGLSNHASLFRKLSTNHLASSKESKELKAILSRRLTSYQMERNQSPPLSETRFLAKRHSKASNKPSQSIQGQTSSEFGGRKQAPKARSEKEPSLKKLRSPSHKSKQQKNNPQASLKALSRKVSLHEVKSSGLGSLSLRKGSLVLNKQSSPSQVQVALPKKMSVPFLHRDNSTKDLKPEKQHAEHSKGKRTNRPYLLTESDVSSMKIHNQSGNCVKHLWTMPWTPEISKALKHPTTNSTRQLLTQPSMNQVSNHPDIPTHRTTATSNTAVKFASYAGYQKPASKIPRTATLADALSILSRKNASSREAAESFKAPFNISPSQMISSAKNLKASFDKFPSTRMLAGTDLMLGACGGHNEEPKQVPWTSSRKLIKEVSVLSTIYPTGGLLSVTPQKPESHVSKKEHSSEATRTSSGLPGNSQNLLVSQGSGDWPASKLMGMPRSHFPAGPKRSVPSVSSGLRVSGKGLPDDQRVDRLIGIMDENISSSRSKPDDNGMLTFPYSREGETKSGKQGTSIKGFPSKLVSTSKAQLSSSKPLLILCDQKANPKQKQGLTHPASSGHAAKSTSKKRKAA